MTSTTTPAIHVPCSQCGAPLDERQRYCVACGASRRHPHDPVARHHTLLARRAAPEEPVAAAAPARRGADLRLTALILALLPVAAALGVLVGRHGSAPGSEDKALLAALRAQPATPQPAAVGLRPAAVAPGATSAASTSARASAVLTLTDGYVIRLRTLPKGSGAVAVAAAERAARAKGVRDVGVLRRAGGDVLFSGQFTTRAAAQKALAALRTRFPSATILVIGHPISGRDKAARIAAADAVIRNHPTAQQKQQGAKVVQQIQAERGRTYVQQQRKLPDTIVVP
jgi:hypothetical protein